VARFLLAWELGEGLGHTVPLGLVGAALLARGHELHLVLRDLSTARAGLGALADAPGVTLWQAPVWTAPLLGLPPPAGLNELLFRAGYYTDPARLLGLAQGWAALLRAIAPDVLVADHAPTALLAARALAPAGWPAPWAGAGGAPLRRALATISFFVPPALAPLPALPDGRQADPRRLAEAESIVLACCNAVLAALAPPGAPAQPLAAVHELFAAELCLVPTWPAFDAYAAGPAGREGVTYLGPLAPPSHGLPPQWPEPAGLEAAPRLFAYLKGNYPAIDAVLQALARAPARTLAWVPGLTGAQRQRFDGARLRLATAPLALDAVLAQADALLGHGGAATTYAALATGVPQLLLPMQAEQQVQAQRVAALAGGRWLALDAAAGRIGAELQSLLQGREPRQRAQAFAATCPPPPEGGVAAFAAGLLEALAAGRAAPAPRPSDTPPPDG
jgi:UDP:flavonoid glycosyltransferase YjiC (YdhE family)